MGATDLRAAVSGCVYLLRDMENEIERLRQMVADRQERIAELERNTVLLAVYRELPESYHQGMLELLVRCAFEAAEISHGRAAELLKEPVQAFRERGWVQGKHDEKIAKLEAIVDMVRRWGCEFHGFRYASDGVHGSERDNLLAHIKERVSSRVE